MTITQALEVLHALPTRMVVQLSKPALESRHPFLNMTLAQWTAGRTDLTKLFDSMLWVCTAGLVALILSFPG